MTYRTQDFDLLNHWARLSDADLGPLATSDKLEVLRRLAEVLADTTQKAIEITEANFPLMVRNLHELYRRGSRGLGEAIISASRYEREGKPAVARKTYEDFISSCPSEFYKQIAVHHLTRIRG